MSDVPYYKPLASSPDEESGDFNPKSRSVQFKRLAFYIIAGCTLMYLSAQGMRAFARVVSKPCHPSHRHHHNLTSIALPAHYTLPSGDKIPSVALGTVNSAS